MFVLQAVIFFTYERVKFSALAVRSAVEQSYSRTRAGS